MAGTWHHGTRALTYMRCISRVHEGRERERCIEIPRKNKRVGVLFFLFGPMTTNRYRAICRSPAIIPLDRRFVSDRFREESASCTRSLKCRVSHPHSLSFSCGTSSPLGHLVVHFNMTYLRLWIPLFSYRSRHHTYSWCLRRTWEIYIRISPRSLFARVIQIRRNFVTWNCERYGNWRCARNFLRIFIKNIIQSRPLVITAGQNAGRLYGNY